MLTFKDRSSEKRTIHILNGQEMYDIFRKRRFLYRERMIPFNEAMCYGETCRDLFSQDFISIRAKVHQVTEAEYSKITLQPLKPLFENDYTRINLWFDTDMFCQINLLTILAWLDHIHYREKIELHLVDNHFEAIDHFTLHADGYKELYDQVLIHKEIPGNAEPPPLKKGVERYLNYLDSNSDLMVFIRGHHDHTVEELVTLLLKEFSAYGLGDQQYKDIIQSYRKQNTSGFSRFRKYQ